MSSPPPPTPASDWKLTGCYTHSLTNGLPWETEGTWCWCAWRRSLCVPLGIQFTALPIHRATSTLAMVLPVILSKSDSMKAEWSCRCPAVIICVYESVISNTPRELGSNQTVRFLPRPSLLPLSSSAVCAPSVQVTTLCWEWFIWAWLTFRRRREVQQWEGLPTQTWGRQAFAKQRSFMLLCLAFASFICLFACLFLCLKKNCSKITFHHADYQT